MIASINQYEASGSLTSEQAAALRRQHSEVGDSTRFLGRHIARSESRRLELSARPSTPAHDASRIEEQKSVDYVDDWIASQSLSLSERWGGLAGNVEEAASYGRALSTTLDELSHRSAGVRQSIYSHKDMDDLLPDHESRLDRRYGQLSVATDILRSTVGSAAEFSTHSRALSENWARLAESVESAASVGEAVGASFPSNQTVTAHNDEQDPYSYLMVSQINSVTRQLDEELSISPFDETRSLRVEESE